MTDQGKSDAGEIRVSAAEITPVVAAIFRAAGLPEADADLVADSLVEADLRGVHSHGLILVPYYVQRLREGGTNATPDVRDGARGTGLRGGRWRQRDGSGRLRPRDAHRDRQSTCCRRRLGRVPPVESLWNGRLLGDAGAAGAHDRLCGDQRSALVVRLGRDARHCGQ